MSPKKDTRSGLKGIILHGGHGTRLRPLTHTGPKQLIPIANKPISQYVLESLRGAGCKEIAIVLGDVFPEKVKEYYGDGSKFGVHITYVHQNQPRGIAQAVGLCEDFVGDSPSLQLSSKHDSDNGRRPSPSKLPAHRRSSRDYLLRRSST